MIDSIKEPLFHGDLVESSRILYTPSEFAKKSLIHLQETGALAAQKSHISKRENLNSFLFFIVISGEGILQYNGTRYNLSAGDCIFIDCRKQYYHKSSTDRLWQLKWVHFNGPNVSDIYNKYTERGGRPCFHPENLNKFSEILENIYELANSADYIRDMRINEKLTSLLTLSMEESWNPDNRYSNTKRKDLQEIKSYIDNNYTDKITLEELSEKFFISKFYLTRLFKDQFGTSINNYLLQTRITHAKKLLRFTDKSIEEVGMECGIEPLYYFSRIFKKVEGVSPSVYRKRW
ncbi:MAG: AraC family transcriptional regulator [Lachnospiraceae bacterium]